MTEAEKVARSFSLFELEHVFDSLAIKLQNETGEQADVTALALETLAFEIDRRKGGTDHA